MSDEEPKIIVDEDWKDQVQREKEQLREKEAATASGGGAEEATEVPPASMTFLISMLSSQVMMAMGFIPGPSGEQPPVDLPMAKHFVDLLGVLQEKTKGNLEEEEEKMLTESLHQFRMAYVQMSQAPGQDGAQGGGNDADPGPTIELA